MKIMEIVTLINEEKEFVGKINLEILKFLYPEFTEYDQRYGVLKHPKLGITSSIPLPNYLGSLEAAIEAIQKFLPQAEWSVFSSSSKQYEGTVWLETDEGTEEFTKLHHNAASALLIAAFNAKEFAMREPEND